MPAAEWNRISRVGTPNVWRKSPHSKQIEIRVEAFPGVPGEAWQGYFARKVAELGINAVCDSMGEAVTGSPPTPPTRRTSRVSLKRSTSPLSMRTPDMSRCIAQRPGASPGQEQKAAEAAQSQVGLDELAAKFAKPDRDT